MIIPRRMRIDRVLVFIFLAAVLLAPVVFAPLHESTEPQTESIFLRGRTIQPGAVNIQTAAVSNSELQIIQFDHTLTPEEKHALQQSGIQLLEYIPRNAWVARVTERRTQGFGTTTGTPQIQFQTTFTAADKIAPGLLENGAHLQRNGKWQVRVFAFEDILEPEARAALEPYGTILYGPGWKNTWSLEIAPENIEQLATNTAIKFIESEGIEIQPYNNGSRKIADVNTVQDAPYNLDGTNIVIAEWDSGSAKSDNPGLAGRVTAVEAGLSDTDHSTHVAGTMIGNGSGDGASGVYKGMAPNATLLNYLFPLTNSASDITQFLNETNDSITRGAHISQNSWGYTLTSNDCGVLGAYDFLVQAFDNMTYGTGGVQSSIIPVAAAGNSQSETICSIDTNNGYNSTPGPGGVAKNAIGVGAVNTNDESMTTFSSWGPMADGRMKPDVVAGGAELDTAADPCNSGDSSDTDNEYKSIWSTKVGSAYGGLCGTSMSAPAVSGVLALMLQDYNATNSVIANASTMKAILLHTAKDLNETGPDYTTGYGLINATRAIEKIREDQNVTNTVHDGNVSAATNESFGASVASGDAELKITVAWTDYPSSTLAGRALVNDLDLIVIAPNGTRVFPWTLDSANPETAAVQTTENVLDNSEQVYVPTPDEGRWTVIINGTSVTQSPQEYSMVSSHSLSTTPIVTLNSPSDNNITKTAAVNFNCTASAILGTLANITLFHNLSGAWVENQTTVIGGITNTSNWTITLPAESSYVWNCRANTTDASAFAGNNFTVTLDQTVPVVTFAAPTPSNISRGLDWVFVNVTLDETGSSTILEWNGTNATMNGSGTIWNGNMTGLSETNYSFKVYANDSADNEGISLDRWVFIDLSGPVLHSISDTPDPTNKSTAANFTVNVTDRRDISNATLEINFMNGTRTNFSMNAIGNDTYSALWNDTVTQVYNYTIYANDTLGNTNSSSGTIEIVQTRVQNTTVITTADTETTVVNETNVTQIDLVTNESIGSATIELRTYNKEPFTIGGVSSKNETTNYFNITLDSTLTGNLSWSWVYFYYNETYLNANSLNESAVEIYKYNGSSWNLISGTGNRTRNETENWVRMNLTSFSLFGLFTGANSTATAVVAESSSASSSGGGGGGGGGGKPLPQETLTVGNTPAGKTSVLTFTKSSDHLVGRVTFTATEDISNGFVKVVKYSGKPGRVSLKPTGNVLAYISIDAVNFKSTAMEDTTIRFKANESWMKRNNIDKDQGIVLKRYISNQWETLETTRAGVREGDLLTYDAVTRGFSDFAITGVSVKADTADPGETETTELDTDVKDQAAETQPELQPIPLLPRSAWIMGLALLVVIGLVFVFYKSEHRGL